MDEFFRQGGRVGDYGLIKTFSHPETGEVGYAMTFVPGEVFEAMASDLLAQIGPSLQHAERIAIEHKD